MDDGAVLFMEMLDMGGDFAWRDIVVEFVPVGESCVWALGNWASGERKSRWMTSTDVKRANKWVAIVKAVEKSICNAMLSTLDTLWRKVDIG